MRLRKTKGLLWLILGALTAFLLIFFAIISSSEPEWCNSSLNAGACELFEENGHCYCIDEDSSYVVEGQLTDVYEHSESRCLSLNGSLAIADNNELLIWLSKRLYYMGIDNAFVALRKLGSKWFWMQKDGSSVMVENVPWRPDAPSSPHHRYSTINVQTFHGEAEGILNEEYGEYDYKSYNYDYYLDYNRNYKWFGFATSDNTADYTRGAHFICNYVYDPLRVISVDLVTGMSLAKELSFDEQCFCALNEQIHLSSVEDIKTFSSPRYPNNYCSDANCKWTISTPEGLVVKLEWVVFSLEQNMDFVDVYNGDSTQSPMIDTCTASHCAGQTSSTHKMMVHFRADHVTTELGFKARVIAIEKDECYCSHFSVVTLVNLHESYSLTSPKFPRPYCVNHDCTWTVVGPEGLGVQLMWYQFNIKSQSHYVHVYDGSTMKLECTANICQDVTSIGDRLQIHFTSDDSQSEHTGFSALIKAVNNYCDPGKLAELPVGSVSYSNIRDDGMISVYETALLTCPPGHKIKDTDSAVSDVIICQSPEQWSKPEFGICIQVCKLDFLVANNGDILYVCAPDNQWLIPSGDMLIQQMRDLHSNQPTSEPHTFLCNASLWTPQPPQCHKTMQGIIMISGNVVWPPHIAKTATETIHLMSQQMTLYLPAKNRTKSLQTILHRGRISPAAVTLPEGLILVTGTRSVFGDSLTFQDYPTELVYLDKQEVSTAPHPIFVRRNAPAVALGARVLICGGLCDTTQEAYCLLCFNSCEMFVDGNWTLVASMLVGRSSHVMVSVQNITYAIGGFGSFDVSYWDSNQDYLSSVEKYSEQNDSWELVASMSNERAMHSATQLNNRIFVCGGIVHMYEPVASCEFFDPNNNQWHPLAHMNLARQAFSLLSYGKRLYALGGESSYNSYMKSVESYDVATNEWKMESDLEFAAAYFSAVIASFEISSQGCLMVESQKLC